MELGELMLRRTHYAREALGLEAINPGPVVREFAVRVPDLDAAVRARPREAGINPGYRLGRDYPEYADGLLVADHRAAHARSTSTGSPSVVGRARAAAEVGV